MLGEMYNTDIKNPISLEALAHLGEGEIAYLKVIRSEEARTLFPHVPEMAPGLKLFALHAADGTPIMLTDSRDAALSDAWRKELNMFSIH
jgi:hypothetical protein